MKKIFFTTFMMLIAANCISQIKYPNTKKVKQEDNYFGTVVNDPYRWLEDDNSEETKEWVIEENKTTNQYLESIPYRNQIKKELSEMWNYPKYSAPSKRGDYYYYYKNDGLQNQSVLYRQTDLNAPSEVFIDPNTMSKDGTAAISSPSFSKNYKYAAYMESQAGSDWQVAYIMQVADKKLLTDKIEYIKFSGLSWDSDDGFYYSRYPVPDEKSKLTNKNTNQAVYYHIVGTPQREDKLIFEDKEHPMRSVGAGLTEDKRFLIIRLSEGTSGTELWVKDTKDPKGKFIQIIKGFDTEAGIVDNIGGKLLVRTNTDAPNYKIVMIDPAHPEKSNWKTIVAEKDDFLSGAGTAGGKIFLSYLKDVASRVYRIDYDGKNQIEVSLPGIGTASGFAARKEDKTLFYTFTSFNYPPTIFKLDIHSNSSTLFRKSDLKMNTDVLETKQVFFTSKDGTKVPMFIMYKKGMKLNRQNPVMLYGYGGFNAPMTPGFSVSNAYFVDKGGIYVVVNLRGGNEYGEKWHKAGMLQNKQNVFDDMIGAAEYLIKENYTNPGKLAVRGGSNGGLLVGAVMTQRPDLFKVAIPQVGVMDMLRYHLFTIGWAWATEYGRSDNEADFKNLYGYSPLHNLKNGASYPATLITTADHDDRVVPAHSFKFAATLQEYNAGPNPVLIRIETKAGHGAGKPTSKQIEEATDIWSFVMYNLGMEFKPY